MENEILVTFKNWNRLTNAACCFKFLKSIAGEDPFSSLTGNPQQILIIKGQKMNGMQSNDVSNEQVADKTFARDFLLAA